MTKHGQLYIFGTILLCSMVFAGVMNKITVKDPNRGLESLYENYVNEAIMAGNSALFQGTDVNSNVRNLTEMFIDYSKTKSQDIGIAYILILPGKTGIITNLLGEEIKVSSGDTFRATVSDDTEKIIKLDDSLVIEIDGEPQEFTVDDCSCHQFKALMMRR